MEISERKRNANRLNALKSTGPKSVEGKKNSSLNLNRHRILANAVVLDNESQHRFADLLNSFNADLTPQDNIERAMVEKMAVCHWRILRSWVMEKAAIVREKNLQSGAVLNEDPQSRTMLAVRKVSSDDRHPDALGRSERRYDREYYNAFESLKKYRREKREDAREEANNEKRTRQSHQPEENTAPPEAANPTTNPPETLPNPLESLTNPPEESPNPPSPEPLSV